LYIDWDTAIHGLKDHDLVMISVANDHNKVDSDIVIDDNSNVITKFVTKKSNLETITTDTNKTSGVKRQRHANIQRPHNWRDIIQYYNENKNCTKTMKKYDLELLNPSNDYWVTTFGRWRKQASNPAFVPHNKGRESVLGRQLESELIERIIEYHKNNIDNDSHVGAGDGLLPLPHLILRDILMSLLEKHGCDNLLQKVEEGELIFGRRWFNRFYVRNNISFDGGQYVGGAPYDSYYVNSDDKVVINYNYNKDGKCLQTEINQYSNMKESSDTEDDEVVKEDVASLQVVAHPLKASQAIEVFTKPIHERKRHKKRHIKAL